MDEGLRGVSRGKPLYQQVYDSLREAITDGTLSVGQEVTEVGVSERLGVSRTPVREAMKQLVREGLLEVRSDGVAFIPEVSVVDVAEVYAIRGVLEGLAAGLAAWAEDLSFLDEMRRLVAEGQNALAAGDAERVFELNGAFHNRLIDASGSKLIRMLIDRVADRLLRYRRWSLRHEEHARIAVGEHEQILRLLESREPLVVQEFVSRHVHRAGWRAVLRLAGDRPPADVPVVRFLAAAADLRPEIRPPNRGKEE